MTEIQKVFFFIFLISSFLLVLTSLDYFHSNAYLKIQSIQARNRKIASGENLDLGDYAIFNLSPAEATDIFGAEEYILFQK